MDDARTALVLPGRQYGHDHPGLYYTRMALESRGWQLRSHRWPDLPQDHLQWPGLVRAQARELIDEIKPQLVVGKSLGSLALPVAAERGLPGIWLTPLVAEPEVAKALPHLPSESLIVGCGGDDSWDGDHVRTESAPGVTVAELPNADHEFNVVGDPVASVNRIATLIPTILRFLDDSPALR